MSDSVLEISKKSQTLGLYGEPYSYSLSMGNQRLDIFMNGGIPAKSNVLYLAPSSDERDIFLVQFVNSGIASGDKILYITTDKSPGQIMNFAEKFGCKLKTAYKKKQLKFIDCYSWTLGKDVRKPDITYVPGPNALNDISISLSRIMTELSSSSKKNIRVVFSSVSTLLLYNDQEVVFKFFQVTGARLKSLNATTLFAVEDNMHDKQILSTLQHLTDVLVHLKKGKTWTLTVSWTGYLLPIPVEFARTGLTIP